MQDRAREIEESDRGWKATREQRYDEAIAIYTALLSWRNSMSGYMNRGITRLLTGDYKGAEADFRMGRDHPSVLPAKLINLDIGVALWLQGAHEAACEDWAYEIRRVRSGEITHAEVSGLDATALLWWASAHPDVAHWRKTADKELKHISRLKTCQRSSWPGPLAPFLLGSLNEAEFLEAVKKSTSSAKLQEHRTRLAHFYVGATYLDKGDIETYKQHLQIVVSEGYDIISEEYHLARYELNIFR